MSAVDELRTSLREQAKTAALAMERQLSAEVREALNAASEDAASFRTTLEELAYQHARRELITTWAPVESSAEYAARLAACDECIAALQLTLKALTLTGLLKQHARAEALARATVARVRDLATTAAGTIASTAIAQAARLL